MALIDPLRRLHNFLAALPPCPRGCPNDAVYDAPRFRVPTADDTMDDQVDEIIRRYEQEAPERLGLHLADDHLTVGVAPLGLRDVLRRVRGAMQAEGCTSEQVERVASWLIYGQPDGTNARVTLQGWETQR